MQEERWAFIERQNKELLGKMNHILHTTGRVDHRNLDWKPKRRFVITPVGAA